MDLLPRNAYRTFAIECVEPVVQLLALRVGERNVVVRQAVPELLDQIESLFRAQLLDVDGRLDIRASFQISSTRASACDRARTGSASLVAERRIARGNASASRTIASAFR